MKVSLSNYGKYSKDNCNTNAVTINAGNSGGGEITIYFYYKTAVGFSLDGKLPVVTQNYWSTTTGKHLNWIDGGGAKVKTRLSQTDFEIALQAALSQFAENLTENTFNIDAY